MSIDLPPNVAVQLRALAAREGRDVRALVEEAIRQYLDTAAITDVGPGDVADAQSALLVELPPVPTWQTDDA